jgi:lysophospholipase L1-like esterase
MRAWLNTQRLWLVVERLPAYAPELNLVGGLWSSLKAVGLANLTGPTLAEVIDQAHRSIERVRPTSHLAYTSAHGARVRNLGTPDEPSSVATAREGGHGASHAAVSKHPGPAADAQWAGQRSRPWPTPLAHRPLYLALGNSVAAGVGASDPVVTGYVPLFYDLLRGDLACRPSDRPGCRKLALDNLAVGGATSTTLVRDQLPDAIAELQARNHDRHRKNDVRVITIDIGGNDVFAVVPLCAAGPTPECLRLIDTTLGTFAANFTTTLTRLRAAAGPDTIIIAMTYDNPLPSCRLSALLLWPTVCWRAPLASMGG